MKIKKMFFVVCFLILFLNISSIKAQQNQILFFGLSIREGLIDIYYETGWGNTTISLKDNGTQLFLESDYTSFAYEGNSTWIYEYITGVHYIEACIYHGVLEQFTFSFAIIVQPQTNTTDVDTTITKSIDACTLAVIILCSLGSIVIISTIVIVIIKTRKIRKEMNLLE